MKVLIADDHPVVRQGCGRCSPWSPISPSSARRCPAGKWSSFRSVPWEVAVLDYNMPGKNGLELIKELRQRYPGRAVLVLSMYPETATRCARSRPERRATSRRNRRPRSS